MYFAYLFVLEQAQQGSGGGMNHFIILLALWLFIIWFVAIRPQKKADNTRLDKLSQMKKNDRVVTIGGIIGVVDSSTDEEVVLKVDDKNGIKIHFLRSAIHRMMEDEDKKEEKKESSSN